MSVPSSLCDGSATSGYPSTAVLRKSPPVKQGKGHPPCLPNEGEEDAGVAVNEHADTWGFSWMPAIEEFVEQAEKAGRRDEEESDCTDDGEEDEEEAEPRAGLIGTKSRSSSRDPNDRSGGGEQLPGGSFRGSGRKRRRPQARGWSPPPSQRRAPRPPSYNETLLADKSFHNPHASETMADAFGILRPASFVLDVEADDRPWGGGAEALAAAKGTTATTANGNGEASAGASGGGDGEGDRSWFYDTVRDRQNRLWADTRVRKGVELARKGQHQVRGFRFVIVGTNGSASPFPHSGVYQVLLVKQRPHVDHQPRRTLCFLVFEGIGICGVPYWDNGFVDEGPEDI